MQKTSIPTENSEELVRRILIAQRDNPTKGDFLVEKDLNQMEEDLDFTQIQSPVLSALQVCNLNIQRYKDNI